MNASSANSKSTIWTAASSQSRATLMDIWKTNSDNVFSNSNNSTNLDQTRLELNNSANIKTTNVSNFNPRNLSV